MLEICEAESAEALASMRSKLKHEEHQSILRARDAEGRSEEARGLAHEVSSLRRKNAELAAREKKLENKIAEVRTFLQSNRGQAMHDMEHALAQKSLQLAQCEEEKDTMEQTIAELKERLDSKVMQQPRNSGTVEAKTGN